MSNRKIKAKLSQQDYNRKYITTVNLGEKTKKFLKFLKQEELIVSVSAGVRQMLNFALPFFLNVNDTIDKALENKLENFTFKKPTLEILRNNHPDIPDYKFINEA